VEGIRRMVHALIGKRDLKLEYAVLYEFWKMEPSFARYLEKKFGKLDENNFFERISKVDISPIMSKLRRAIEAIEKRSKGAWKDYPKIKKSKYFLAHLTRRLIEYDEDPHKYVHPFKLRTEEKEIPLREAEFDIPRKETPPVERLLGKDQRKFLENLISVFVIDGNLSKILKDKLGLDISKEDALLKVAKAVRENSSNKALQKALAIVYGALIKEKEGWTIPGVGDFGSLQETLAKLELILERVQKDLGVDVFSKEKKTLFEIKRSIVKNISKKGIMRDAKIRLAEGKIWLDNYPGTTGRTCFEMDAYGVRLGMDDYHIIQIIDQKTGKNEGTIHAFTREVSMKGGKKKALILVGVEPKERLLKSVNPSEFLKKVVDALHKMYAPLGISTILSTQVDGWVSNRAELHSRILSRPEVKLKKGVYLYPKDGKFRVFRRLK
jgi:hypothetical protein